MAVNLEAVQRIFQSCKLLVCQFHVCRIQVSMIRSLFLEPGIGTSLLYKCRMLPDLWPKVNEIQPDLKIEIRPMKEYENHTMVFSRLGLDFDLFEGIYASAWKGSCQFLELKRTPLCCAVSPRKIRNPISPEEACVLLQKYFILKRKIQQEV